MVNWSRVGIPEAYQNISWKSIKELLCLSVEEIEIYHKVYYVAGKWVKEVIDKKRVELGLFFTGANGAGKTALACSIVKALVEKDIPAFRLTMIKLQQQFYDGWQIPDMALTKSVLVIDEVGKEYRTKQDHSETMLEYILKYRSERLLPTILIANADIQFLSKRYGETVNSVLRGKFIPLNFPEIDLRQRLVQDKIQNLIGEIDEN